MIKLLFSYMVCTSDSNAAVEQHSRYYVNFAAAATCKPENIRSWECRYYCRGIKEGAVVVQSRLMNTQMYIKINEESKDIILSFRAAKDLRNWLVGFAFVAVPTWFMHPKYMAHTGFLAALKPLSMKYLPLLKDYIKKHPDYSVVFTGHSLGAALSVLGLLNAKHALNIPWQKLKLFTYGQPRVGNKAMAEYLNSNLINSARYVNQLDPVPHVPPKDVMGFTHHHNEIWFNNYKAYFGSNDTMEDPSGSAGVKDFNVADHSMAWDTQFGLDC